LSKIERLGDFLRARERALGGLRGRYGGIIEDLQRDFAMDIEYFDRKAPNLNGHGTLRTDGLRCSIPSWTE
jgi:hypothetical protein